MPLDGELVAAAAAGWVEEVQTLLAGCANIEENDSVNDGATAGIERFVCCWFCLAQ